MSDSGESRTPSKSKDFKNQDYSIVAGTGTLVANPALLGLAAFGITTFVLSCYNATIDVPAGAPPTIVLGLALFYGGLTHLLAGMREFKAGNTFGATAFSSYGAFWLSFACILIPGFGETKAFDANNFNNARALDHEIGIFLLGWTIFTFIMFLCTLWQNIVSILLFGMLDKTFFPLSILKFQSGSPNQESSNKATGYTGLMTSFIALYIVLANLANKEHTYFTLPVGIIGSIEKKLYD